MREALDQPPGGSEMADARTEIGKSSRRLHGADYELGARGKFICLD